jgi:hypothetical protein
METDPVYRNFAFSSYLEFQMMNEVQIPVILKIVGHTTKTWLVSYHCSEHSFAVGRENIFKPTIGNESLHKISNDNGVKAANFATSKNFSQKYDVPTL